MISTLKLQANDVLHANNDRGRICKSMSCLLRLRPFYCCGNVDSDQGEAGMTNRSVNSRTAKTRRTKRVLCVERLPGRLPMAGDFLIACGAPPEPHAFHEAESVESNVVPGDANRDGNFDSSEKPVRAIPKKSLRV